MTSPDSLPPKKVFHLAVEVSTPEGSLAFFEDDQLLWSHSWSRTSSHSEMLTQTLASGLAQTAKTLGDLDFASVTRGPGSFTGLRVGINLVKTLGLSLNIPLIAPTTLEILAASARENLPEGSHLLVAMNAFKGMVYWCTFQKKEGGWWAQAEPAASSWHEVSQSLTEDTYYFLGDGYLPFEHRMPAQIKERLDLSHGEETFPSALTLGLWSWNAFQQEQGQSWQTLSPLYIRRSEAEEKRSKVES